MRTTDDDTPAAEIDRLVKLCQGPSGDYSSGRPFRPVSAPVLRWVGARGYSFDRVIGALWVGVGVGMIVGYWIGRAP